MHNYRVNSSGFTALSRVNPSRVAVASRVEICRLVNCKFTSSNPRTGWEMWVGNTLTLLHSLINNTLDPSSITTELVSGQYVCVVGVQANFLAWISLRRSYWWVLCQYYKTLRKNWPVGQRASSTSADRVKQHTRTETGESITWKVRLASLIYCLPGARVSDIDANLMVLSQHNTPASLSTTVIPVSTNNECTKWISPAGQGRIRLWID